MFYKNYFASYWQDSDEHHFSLKLPSSCDIGFSICVFSLLICSIRLFFHFFFFFVHESRQKATLAQLSLAL